MNKCKCGCGQTIGKGKTWISGHNTRQRRKKPVFKNCKICGKEFSGRPSFMKNRKVCGLECRNKNNAGENNPTYRRVKASCPVCDTEFTATPHQISKGKTCSMECGRISRSRKISGTRRILYGRGKNAARRRDDFKCVICKFDIVTAVHHIKHKKNGGTDDVDNLITLCPNHHYMCHAGIFTDEYLRSLIPKYTPEVDVSKPNSPRKHDYRVEFRA